MLFIFKIKHITKFILLISFFILSNCQLKEPIKGHGINFLENRSKKISLEISNKNDVLKILGNPHTKSIDDENIWFYFDRKVTAASITAMKSEKLLENNVLVVRFNDRGIVSKKEFFNKDDMKKIVYSGMKTNNPVSRQSFVTKFLQSVKQKMYGKK